MYQRKGYTLIEILVVLVIIGTLAALAWPNYMAIKEKTLNREAKANLALIRAAEKIYRMEQGFYYPRLDTTDVISDINSFLKLSLPESASVSWSISIDSTGAPETAEAQRVGGSGADGRIWSISFPGETEPSCSGGSYCPP